MTPRCSRRLSRRWPNIGSGIGRKGPRRCRPEGVGVSQIAIVSKLVPTVWGSTTDRWNRTEPVGAGLPAMAALRLARGQDYLGLYLPVDLLVDLQLEA